MIRIVHFSDWHGHATKLPEADLYVCTGDMLLNWPEKVRDPGAYDYRGYRIVPERERELQTKQMNQFITNGGLVRYLGSPGAPVVVVRGNHDFVDLAPYFGGCNLIHEFVNNELIVVPISRHGGDVRITGHRGIPIINGRWQDEMSKPDLLDRVRAMPEADLFLTHYPPAGMLDSSMPPGLSMGGGWAETFGLDGMVQALLRKVTSDYVFTDNGLTEQSPARAAHCFGHIHECGGYQTQAVDVIFSNAATSVNVFDIEPVGAP